MTAKSQERIDAVASGLRVYSTGKPCRKGHTSPRYVSNNQCITCQSECAAEYEIKNAKKMREQRVRWVAENKERVSNVLNAWRKENHERTLMHKKVRRARKRANGGKLSSGIIDRLMILQRSKCACCHADLKCTNYHLDHMMPLARGGKNEDLNIQLLCPTCNMSKHASHPIDFMQSRGFLL